MKEKGKRKKEKRDASVVTGILLFVSFSFFLFPFSFAASPATQPAEQVRRWFDDLADNDPNTRDAARINLMGLSRNELEILRQVVDQNRPIAPSQAATLHEIVTHVFLATEPCDRNPQTGFLGVKLDDFHQLPVGPPENADPASAEIDGVIVKQCVPGFCGARYLRENDIVLGVLAQDFIATRDRDALRSMVQATLPGETITLQLLRQGKSMRVSFKVDAIPQAVDGQVGVNIDEFCNPRIASAEQYWREKFTPLLKPSWS